MAGRFLIRGGLVLPAKGHRSLLGLPQVPSAIRERRRTLRYRNLLVRQMVQTVWLKQGNRQSRLCRCYAAAPNG